MTTPLYPTFQKRVRDAVDLLIKRQVTPWVFMTAGSPFRIRTFDGEQIAYQRIQFAGSPSQVFWTRYIEPFLEDLCISEVAMVLSMSKEKGVDPRPVLSELQAHLSAGCQRVYVRMAEIDRNLRGQG